MKRRLTFYLIFALALSAGIAGARVFMRGRSGDVISQFQQAIKGKTAYRSQVNINGSDGEMTVLSIPSDLDTVSRLLRRLYPNGTWEDNGRMGQGHVENGTATTRLIAIRIEEQHSSIVFALTQSTRAFEAARRGPSHHLMQEVAPFEGSRPHLYVKDDATQFSLAMSKSFSPAPDIQRSFARRLAARGWHPVTVDGAQIYRRELDLCVVLVSPSAGNTENTITVLHKRPGRE